MLKGESYDLNDVDVIATIGLDDVVIFDNPDEGEVNGEIILVLFLGDHYRITIRTEDEEDFVANTPYQWNEGDLISLSVEPSKIELKLKGALVAREKN